MTRSREWLLEFSAQRFGIPREVLEKASEQADEAGLSWHHFAAEQGILDSVQVSIVQTLSHPDQVLEDYEFLDMLGRGAMGVVYRARQKSLNRTVAIKTILPGAAKLHGRFKVEAQTIAKLHHPNIVTPFEFFERNGRLFLVLELLEGGTLADRLNRDGAMSEMLAWNLVLQTASGLLYARRHNVVHRDIKPQNLFLLERPPGSSLPKGVPYLKIADFGLAASIDRSQDTSLTLEGNVIGTPIYMSPEQAGDSHVDHRADMYALGATAYHMLAGEPLYAGESLMRILVKKQSGESSRLNERFPHISKASSDLVFDLMRRNPEHRPDNYQVIIDRIQEILGQGDVVSSGRENSHRGVAFSEAETQPVSLSERETVELPTVEAVPTSEPTRFRRNVFFGLLGGVLGVGVLGMGLYPGSWLGRPAALTATEMSYTGRAIPLFDGSSVKGWNAIGGSVDAKLDYERVGVLEVAGEAAIDLPPYSHAVFSVGINILEAADVTFAFQGESGKSALSVTVSRESLQVRAPDSEFEPQPLQKDPWRNVKPDEPAYRELRVESEPNRWVVSLDGREQLVVPPPTEVINRLTIATDEPCHFEGVQIAETTPSE